MAKIINEENYEWGVVKFGDGKIVFEGNESDTIWPGKLVSKVESLKGILIGMK